MDNSYGITMDIAGPTSVRANDLRVLGDSDMVNRLNTLFVGEEVKYKIFGDSIYRERQKKKPCVQISTHCH